MFASKTLARQHFLTARAARPAEDLLPGARSLPLLQGAQRIALYVSMGAEPQTGALIDWLLAGGHEVLLPILYADNDLGWGVAPGAADLVPGGLDCPNHVPIWARRRSARPSSSSAQR